MGKQIQLMFSGPSGGRAKLPVDLRLETFFHMPTGMIPRARFDDSLGYTRLLISDFREAVDMPALREIFGELKIDLQKPV